MLASRRLEKGAVIPPPGTLECPPEGVEPRHPRSRPQPHESRPLPSQPVAIISTDVAAADHGGVRGLAAAGAGLDVGARPRCRWQGALRGEGSGAARPQFLPGSRPKCASVFRWRVTPRAGYNAGVGPAGVRSLARCLAPGAASRRPSAPCPVRRGGGCFRAADRTAGSNPASGLGRPRGPRPRLQDSNLLSGGPESPPRPRPGSRRFPGRERAARRSHRAARLRLVSPRPRHQRAASQTAPRTARPALRAAVSRRAARR